MATPSPFELLEAFYPSTPPKGRLALYTTTLRTATERNYWCFNLREADRRCSKYRNSRRVLFGPALHNTDIVLRIAKSRRGTAKLRNIRGCEASVTALPALWVEIPYRDYAAHPGHATSLPPDHRHALDLLQAIDQRPSIVISGDGKISAFWLLDRPWVFDLEDQQAVDKAEAKALLRRCGWAIACLAAERGWNVDVASTWQAATLAAAFPIPDSPLGASAKGPRAELETFPLISGDVRYHRGDFECLPEPPTKAARPWQEVLEPPACIPASRTYSLGPIVRGCEWLGHCHTDRATLDKKELELATELLRDCDAPGADSAELTHTLYSGHPGYNSFDVDKKIAAARRAPGRPITCTRISRAPGVLDRFCSVCPHFGQIDAPFELALEDRASGNDQGANRPSAHGLMARDAWPKLPDVESARAEKAMLAAASPGAEHEAQAAELLAGLEIILVSLGGTATARQITRALAAESQRWPRLTTVLPHLIPDFDPGAPKAAVALGTRFRGLKGRVFGGRTLIKAGHCRDGIAWTIRPVSPVAPRSANDPQEETTA